MAELPSQDPLNARFIIDDKYRTLHHTQSFGLGIESVADHVHAIDSRQQAEMP